MPQESMRRRWSKRDLHREVDGFVDDLDSDAAANSQPQEDPSPSDETRSPSPSREGLHTTESLAEHIRAMAGTFEQWGYTHVTIDPSHTVLTYNKELYAVRLCGREISTNRQLNGWVMVAISSEQGTVQYRNTFNNEIIDTVSLPANMDVGDWLQSESERAKVVKSRPTWMYPEQFDLPPEEVWPKHASIAVIGDPYQACDREGVTIIEYEYADEMLPSVLYAYLKHRESPPHVRGWLESLYHEEIDSLERIYGGATPYRANPYKQFVEHCFDLAQSIGERMMHDTTDHPEQREQLRDLKTLGKTFLTGSWSMADAAKLCGVDSFDHYIEQQYAGYHQHRPEMTFAEYEEQYGHDLRERFPEIQAALREWFDLKQSALDAMGNPERWNEFLGTWNDYLDNLPMEFLQQRIDGLDKKITQARHWLSVLPTAKSPDRVTTGMRELEMFYSELRTYHNPEQPETAALENFDIEQATDRDWGSFGYFVPGYPVSLRTKKIIEEALARCEQLLTYSEGFFPAVLKEQRRLRDAGVEFDPETSFSYFSTLERAYARQHFFRKRTQHAAALHGFFPYRMPGIEPQDRIIALNSVTMHGWNHLNEQGFYDECKMSLDFLLPGGKYILGPVNQYIYFGGIGESFDAAGLTRALQRLESEGLITYEFHKGKRMYETGDYVDDEVLEVEAKQQDNRVLEDHESAHSLVITKL